MKRFPLYILFFLLFIFNKPLFAQNPETIFIVPDSILVVNTLQNDQKKITINASGFLSHEQFEAFSEKIKTLRGVEYITFSKTTQDSVYQLNIMFYKYANRISYFQEFFYWCGVSYIIIGQEKVIPTDFTKIKFE